jgi:uncharacterized protein involved in exopolysaccharide biosynthesis
VVENKTIQAYKEQRAKLQIEYQENLRIYKPDFPKSSRSRPQIGEIDAQIKTEVQNVLGSLQAQRDSALKQEEMLRERWARPASRC